MSENENNTLHEIKKKKLSQKQLEAKKNNIKKALAKKKEINENNKKKFEFDKIKNELNLSSSSSSDISDDNKKDNKKINIVDNKNYEDQFNKIFESMNSINKKVEKLYTMKKMKKDKPIIIENSKNNKDEVLNAIRNKMMNL